MRKRRGERERRMLSLLRWYWLRVENAFSCQDGRHRYRDGQKMGS